MKLFPVPNAAPPIALANQLNVPAVAEAFKLTVPASHLEFGVMAVMVGTVLTVSMTAVLVEVQLPVLAST